MLKKAIAVLLCALLSGAPALAAEIPKAGAAGSGEVPASKAMVVYNPFPFFTPNPVAPAAAAPAPDMKLPSLPPAAIPAPPGMPQPVDGPGPSSGPVPVQKPQTPHLTLRQAKAQVSSALLNLAFYGYGLWRGRSVTDANFDDFKRAEVFAGRLDAGLAELVQPHRGRGVGLAQDGVIQLRPELIAAPRLFHRVLQEQLGHWYADPTRGPPAGLLPGDRVAPLQHILQRARVSLALAQSYELLVLNAASPDLKDPELYRRLSGHQDLAVDVREEDPLQVLNDPKNIERFPRMVVGQSSRALAPEGSAEAQRLSQTIEQLEGVAALAQKSDRLDWTVRKFWQQTASSRLKDTQIYRLVASLYQALPDHGVVLLPFSPGELGLPAWEQFLRFWTAADGGSFHGECVDRHDGSHVLVLTKVEDRVTLRLRPKQGHVAVSILDADLTPEGRTKAREDLAAAGFGPQLERFDKLGVRILHVLGEDAGPTQIFITVPKKNAQAIENGNPSVLFHARSSIDDFEPELLQARRMHQVGRVWKQQINGQGGLAVVVDTGGREGKNIVGDEGMEGWDGHGAHVAAIIDSLDKIFRGLAFGARVLMAKVSSPIAQGISDCSIMAGSVWALQMGADVISLSLGRLGSSTADLCVYLSQLMGRKNANGEHPLVLASAGNPGPFDQSMSQPGAARGVFSVAAAVTKTVMAFFSASGYDEDGTNYYRRRRYLKPDAAARGGDLTSGPNPYEHGVVSEKSRHSPQSPADLPGGRQTRMSGTSQAQPMAAAIALLVKRAMRLFQAETDFVRENYPLVLSAILKRTAADMENPTWLQQGAGLLDAYAAVKLVAAESGRSWLGWCSRLVGRAAPEAWSWVRRYQAVLDLEDRIFETIRVPEMSDWDNEDEQPSPMSQAQIDAVFKKAVNDALPRLLEALKDPVWLIRHQAVWTLVNLNAPKSVPALMDAALNDADGRVRRMAFVVLAEMSSHTANARLKEAVKDPRWEVPLFAAYALARHGDVSERGRLVAALSSPDRRARLSAVWLLGQLADKATSVEAEALSAVVKNRSEEHEIRHKALAALSNLVTQRTASSTMTDTVIKDILEACGRQGDDLLRTAFKFLRIARRSQAFVARLRCDAVKPQVSDFILRHKAAIRVPGHLGDIVNLLAELVGQRLDLPTLPMDPAGEGVAGVDPEMGALDVLVSAPVGQQLSDLSPETLSQYETEKKTELPLSRSLWLSVPVHKMLALRFELEARGFRVEVSKPEYALSLRLANPAWNGLTVDPSAGPAAIAADADLSLVRVAASGAVSEAKVMAVLESLAARRDLAQPMVISLSLGQPVSSDSPLTRLINRLLLKNILVVLPAGNEGPSADSLSALAQGAPWAVVVGSLQAYSSRGPAVSWRDAADDGAGTGVAAEHTAAALHAMVQLMIERLGKLPEGSSFYIKDLARSVLSPTGLLDESKAMEVLKARLSDPAEVERQCAQVLAAVHGPLANAAEKQATVLQALENSIFSAVRRISGKAQAKPRMIASAGDEDRPAPQESKRRSVPAKDSVEQYVRERKAVLGGGSTPQGWPQQPHAFSMMKGKPLPARNAGLDGFLYSRLEIQSEGGGNQLDPGALDKDFAYLNDLLVPYRWTAPLRQELKKLWSSPIPSEEKSRRLDGLLAAAVKGYHAELEAADASDWFREAAIYEIPAKAYNRLKDDKNFFDSLDDEEMKRVKDMGFNTIWLQGIFKIGKINRFWPWGSPYSLHGYHADDLFGGDEALKSAIRRAHALGLKVIVDQVPNHVALDSELVQLYPEAVIHIVPPQHLSVSEIQAQAPPGFFYMETERYPENGRRVHKKILVKHPRTDEGGYWLEQAQIDYTQMTAREWQVSQAVRLASEIGVDGFRRDMAYYISNARYFSKWQQYLIEDRDRSAGWAREALGRFLQGFEERWEKVKAHEVLEDMTWAPKQAKPSAVMFDEAYGFETNLSVIGTNGVYNKNNHDEALGQIGLYDAVHSRVADWISAALRNVAFSIFQRGGLHLLNFICTHDTEGNPVDKFGQFLKATALMVLLLRPMLSHAGMEQGVGQWENIIGDLAHSQDREKFVPYDIEALLNWAKADPDLQGFLKFVLAKSADYSELISDGAMDVLRPTDKTSIAGYTVSGPGPHGRKTILVAGNFSHEHAGGWFRFPAVLAPFGAFKPDPTKNYILREMAHPWPNGQPIIYRASGREMAEKGLYLGLDGGNYHLFEIEEAGP